MTRFSVTWLTLLLLGFTPGCGSPDEERPPAYTSLGGAHAGNASAQESTCEKLPEIDTAGTCGSETVELFQQKPTIYFVLDVSGSMADSVQKGEESKLSAAKEALITVATEVGHRVKYGLTIFPGSNDDFDLDNPDNNQGAIFGCAPGDEVFAVQEGDPIECLNYKPNGPVLKDFKQTVNALSVAGGTPLSPTIEKLIPTLAGQEGQIAVVLVTDGSPNCNPEAVCAIEDCGANRGSYSIRLEDGERILCDDDLNCCDPDAVGDLLEHPQAECVDIDASERALEFLRDAGVNTYVIGVLGGQGFDDEMNRLAHAGGAARDGSLAYYDVESLDELSDTVRLIGTELAQRCEIELVERPPQANELNVYLDGLVVPWGDEHGWTLADDVVTLHGDACDLVKSGEVAEIQLVSGCRTVIR